MMTTKHPLVTVSLLLLSASLYADNRGKLIFEDDFQRNESQETKEEVGNHWTTNSDRRAGGNKQVDLHDGAIYIHRHPSADHAVSVVHAAEFRNGIVDIRFMLENKGDSLGLDFADLQLKTVHAGHLFRVTVGLNKLDITDMKTGSMSEKIQTLKKGGKLSPEIRKMLATKKKVIPVNLKTGKWYDLSIKIAGDTVSVAIDGKKAGSFASEGFAHPTKRMIRLAVPKNAVVDDLKIYSTGGE